MRFFCSQCRKEYNLEAFEEFITKTGKKMGKTTCPVCGMVLFRRLDTDYHVESEQEKQ